MEISEMSIPDAYRLTPSRMDDRRGMFFESWRLSALSGLTGRPFPVRQVNVSVSRRNTLRGIHTTATPPGQAKLVTCVRGVALEAVVDLRVGSPTFGRHETVLRRAEDGGAVYLSEGIGYAFLALTDDVWMHYLCSAEYLPEVMVDVHALDPDIGIDWRLDGPPIMSDKDAAAPGLTTARKAGILPDYDACRACYARSTEPAAPGPRTEMARIAS